MVSLKETHPVQHLVHVGQLDKMIVVVVVVVVAFPSLVRIWGESLNIHSLPALFWGFLGVFFLSGD